MGDLGAQTSGSPQRVYSSSSGSNTAAVAGDEPRSYDDDNKFSALGHRFCALCIGGGGALCIILAFFVFIFVIVFGTHLLANRWTSGAPGLVELPLTVFISKPWWDWQGAFLLCSEADCKQPIASFRERFLTWTTTGYMMNSEYQHNLTVSYDTMWSLPWQSSPYTIAETAPPSSG